MCFTTELAQNAGGFLKEASSLVSPQAFEKRYGKKQFPLIEEPSGALEIVILKCLSVRAVCLKDAVLLNVHKKYRETGSSGSEVSLSADFDAKLLFLKDRFSPSTRRYRKYLALCKKNRWRTKILPITCRNCWICSRDAFSPFCSKIRTCCFSDSSGNCCSWNRTVSHCLRPQHSLPFFFLGRTGASIPRSTLRWIPAGMEHVGVYPANCGMSCTYFPARKEESGFTY